MSNRRTGNFNVEIAAVNLWVGVKPASEPFYTADAVDELGLSPYTVRSAVGGLVVNALALRRTDLVDPDTGGPVPYTRAENADWDEILKLSELIIRASR